MTLNARLHHLWPTPVGVHRYDRAETLNPLLVAEFAEKRASQEESRGIAAGGPFFASDDDLMHKVNAPGWTDLVEFVLHSVADTVTLANKKAWGGVSLDLRVDIEGMWFQVNQGDAFHDVHTHGNCSWSGVYIVQIDPPDKRVEHPVYGAANGVTRLYGPPFTALGGAYVDVGNAYLQPPSQDVEPIPGQLLLFPSWLAHQALPYGGEADRVIISFNASVHGLHSDQIHGYSPT
jgi:hypothetical protein